MFVRLHEYRPIYRFEAVVKTMELILTRECSFQLILLSLLHYDRVSSRNHGHNFVLWKTLIFSVLWLCSWMYWHRIAAAAAAAAAAFRGGLYREGNGFPMHAGRFIFVSTLFESCEPYSCFFFFVQWWRSELFNDGTCAGGWFWIHSRNFFVGDYRQPLRQWLSQFEISALIPASWISPGCACSHEHSLGCTRTLGCGGCSSMQRSGLSFSLPFHLEPTLLGMKDLLFVLLGFPRHASLRDRSPESSEPCVKFADQNHIGRSHFFLPRISLESISFFSHFQVYLKISSHRHAVKRDETTCACFHLQRKIRWKAFLRSFHRNEFLPFPCNINVQLNLFWPQILACLHSSPRIVHFFSEEFRLTL